LKSPKTFSLKYKYILKRGEAKMLGAKSISNANRPINNIYRYVKIYSPFTI